MAICPACDANVLVVEATRQGGTAPQVFDPQPGTGDRYDTKLSDDLAYVAVPAVSAQNLRGRIPLYRSHRWSCPNQLKVRPPRACPSWGGYSQAASGGKDAATAAISVPSWPQPWQGVKGAARRADDLLSLDDAAMPRRRMMVTMALNLYQATLIGQLTPDAMRMGKRLRDPRTGDVVCEVTAAARPGGERRGFGILLDRRREWLPLEAEYSLAMGDEPDELSGDGSQGAGDVWYLQYGPGPEDVARWDNAGFIAVVADDRASGD